MVTFTLASIREHESLCVRCWLEQEEDEGETVRSNRADWAIIEDLVGKRGEKEEDEYLLREGAPPPEAVPLFRFWLVTRATRYGYVYSADYAQQPGCPTAVAAEGMHLYHLVKSCAKRNQRKTVENAAAGRKVRLT